MAVTLHANNAFGYLLNAVAPTDTTIVLQSGQGALFPSIAAGVEQFYVTVENRAIAGAMEIMLVTAKAVDSFSVLRHQQGTTAISFSAGTSVSNRVTAGFLNDFDSRISDATETAEAAAVAAATSLAAATAANSGLALKANIASPALTGVPTAPTAAPGANTFQLATTAFVTAAVAAAGGGGGSGATLDSPNFTGVPTAPTAAPGTNTTQLATTAFVTTATAASIVGLAPLASPTFTGVPAGPTAAPGTNTTQLATTAFLAAAGALKANITSPAFLGIPTAPTATAGTNTTQLATTAFVTAAVAAVSVGGGSDPLKADLASPAFTGIPTAPTAIPSTNTNQLATTGFVQTVVTQGVSGLLASPAFTGVPTAPTAAPGTNTAQLATTSFVSTAVSGLAPLASPTFTGTPLAPTAAPGTSTTQVATTAFVTTALVSIPDPAVWAKLASPAFTGTPTAPNVTQGVSNTQIANTAFVTIGLATKVSAASPALTGVPTAPTAAPGTSTTQIATTEFATLAIAGKANIASPTFTGTPTAPTPSPGVSNTQIATTAFVTPVVATKAPLADPLFTGVPRADTAAPGTSSTQLATTAFVAGAISSGAAVGPATAAQMRSQPDGLLWATPQSIREGWAKVTLVPSGTNLSLDAANFQYGEATVATNIDVNAVTGMTPEPVYFELTASGGGARTFTMGAFENKGNVGTAGIPCPDGLTARFMAWGDGAGEDSVWFVGFSSDPWAPTASTRLAYDANRNRVLLTAAQEAAALVPSFVGPYESWIPASAMDITLTAGATRLADFETPTNDLPFRGLLSFSSSSTQSASFDAWLNKAFNGVATGQFYARFVWMHPTAQASAGCVWTIKGRAYGDGGPIDQALGTAVSVTKLGGAALTIYLSDYTLIGTLNGTAPFNEKYAKWVVTRDQAAAGDTLPEAAYLVGVILKLTMTAMNDA